MDNRMPTIVELLSDAWKQLDQFQPAGQHGGPDAREFAIAKTHVEDAIMRTNKGMSLRYRMVVRADLQKEAAVLGMTEIEKS